MDKNSWNQEKIELDQALSGDITAIEKIVSNLSTPSFKFAYKILLDVQDAEDCVQDSFCKLWKTNKKFQGNSSLKTYFFKIVLHSAFNILRIRKEVIWEDDIEIQDEVGWREKAIDNETSKSIDSLSGVIDVQKALARIGPRQRSVLILWAFYDFSSKEISEMMNLNKNAVDQLLHRGKQNLKSYLSGY